MSKDINRSMLSMKIYELFFFWVAMESTMYHTMLIHIPAMLFRQSPVPIITNTDSANRKRILLSFQEKFLNFSANMGISATIIQLDRRIMARRIYADRGLSCRQEPMLMMNAPQNKALAGVGNPINEDVCRVSRLNFASLRAEKAAIRKAQ